MKTVVKQNKNKLCKIVDQFRERCNPCSDTNDPTIAPNSGHSSYYKLQKIMIGFKIREETQSLWKVGRLICLAMQYYRN